MEVVEDEEVNECHNSRDLIANQCKQFVVHEALQETPPTTMKLRSFGGGCGGVEDHSARP